MKSYVVVKKSPIFFIAGIFNNDKAVKIYKCIQEIEIVSPHFYVTLAVLNEYIKTENEKSLCLRYENALKYESFTLFPIVFVC